MQTLLLLSLFSPLVEAFPNLYMSWWAPTNGELEQYLKTWPRRVAIVLIVWIPLLLNLSKIVEPSGLIWIIAALVFSAFGLRLYLFDRSLIHNQKPGNSADTPSKLPELLYLIAFSTIGIVLYQAVPNHRWLVPVAILTILLGASAMATFRRGPHTNLMLDVLGRTVFVTGFILNLYNLERALPL